MRKQWAKEVERLKRLISDPTASKQDYAEACEEIASDFEAMADAARHEIEKEDK